MKNNKSDKKYSENLTKVITIKNLRPNLKSQKIMKHSKKVPVQNFSKSYL